MSPSSGQLPRGLIREQENPYNHTCSHTDAREHAYGAFLGSDVVQPGCRKQPRSEE